jgi:DNA-binding response OmpR family regulator
LSVWLEHWGGGVFLSNAWRCAIHHTKRALESVVSRLRKKISQAVNDDKIRSIQSVWGTGYQLCLPIAVVSINQ